MAGSKKTLWATAGDRVGMVSRLAEASYQGRRNHSLFDGVQTYCMYIGYPRSGHSMIAGLLEAHPNIVFSHELDALRYIQGGHMTRDRLFALILKRERLLAGKWKGYSYSVPDQWQGKFSELLVIGDKKGGGSTIRLRTHPELLAQLSETVQVDVKIIHVVRNPFDNISTMSKRENRTLEQSTEKYFKLCETNERIRRRDDTTVLDVRHEDLIRDPGAFLSGLSSYLGVQASPEYLAACAGVIFSSPHRSRTEWPWTPEMIDDVEQRMKSFEFLDGYSFDAEFPEQERETTA